MINSSAPFKVKDSTFNLSLSLPPHSSTLSLDELQQRLKDNYLEGEKDIYRVMRNSPKLSIEDCFVNIAIVKKELQRQDETVKLKYNLSNPNRSKIYSGYEDIFNTQEKTPITLNDLFNPREGKIPKHLIIFGRAGIGKSTLTQKLVYEFASRNLWQEKFEFIFKIKLRNLTKSRYKKSETLLSYIIAKECFSKTSLLEEDLKEIARTVAKIINERAKKTLIILDGLDEFNQEYSPCASAINELLNNKDSCEINLLVTSRPFIKDFNLSNFNLELEGMGFSTEDVRRYITLKEIGLNEHAQQQMLEYLEKNSAVYSIVHVPLMLDIFCAIWDTHLPKIKENMTLTEFFQILMIKLWETYDRRQKAIYPQMGLEKLQDNKEKAEKFLEKLAFNAIKSGEIMLNGKLIHESIKAIYNFDNHYVKQCIQPLLDSGFLCSPDYTEDSYNICNYYFPHLTFQEYFAASDFYHELGLEKNEETKFNSALEQLAKTDLNSELIVSKFAIVEFLAEMIKDSSENQRRLLDIVMASKKTPEVAIAAANAITVLNYAKVSFAGMDLSQIKIPGADLSDSILDKTNFQGANLNDVKFLNSFMRETNFHNASMKKTYFGQLPYLRHSSCVKSIAFSPDGKLLASGYYNGVENLKLWNIKEGSYKLLKGHAGVFMESVVFSSNGKLLASIDRSEIRIWETETKKCIQKLKTKSFFHNNIFFSPNNNFLACKGEIPDEDNSIIIEVWSFSNSDSIKIIETEGESFAFTLDSNFLILGKKNGEIQIIKTADGSIDRDLKAHEGEINSISCSQDGKWMVSGGVDTLIKLWDVSSWTCIKKFEQECNTVSVLLFSPNGKELLIGQKNGFLKILQIHNEKIFGVKAHQSIKDIKISASGNYLASLSMQDNTVRLWQKTEGGRYIHRLMGFPSEVNAIAFSSDEKLLAVASSDYSVQLFKIKNLVLKEAANPFADEVQCIAFSPDRKLLCSLSRDGFIRLWSIINGQCLKVLNGHQSSISSVCFSKKGHFFASGGSNGVINIWCVSNWTRIKTLKNPDKRILCVTFNEDESLLAFGCNNGEVGLWRPFDNFFQLSPAHKGEVNTVCFFLNRKVLVSVGNKGNVILWNISDSNYGILKVYSVNRDLYKKPMGGMVNVKFCNSKNLLAVGNNDGTITLWQLSLSNIQFTRTLKGHESGISEIAFSSEGEFLVSGSLDHTIRLWRISDGECLEEIYGHEGCVESVAFSIDGKYIASGSSDSSIKLWRLENHQTYLQWTTQNYFFCYDANIVGSMGLSKNKQRLLEQDKTIKTSLQKYSNFFTTLYDENSSNQYHCSVFRANQKLSHRGEPFDFAVIWDEDHDTRVIEILEYFYQQGRLEDFIVCGERKGTFTVIVNDASKYSLRNIPQEYSCEDGDCWCIEFFSLHEVDKSGLIQDSEENIRNYINLIIINWRLGRKIKSWCERLEEILLSIISVANSIPYNTLFKKQELLKEPSKEEQAFQATWIKCKSAFFAKRNESFYQDCNKACKIIQILFQMERQNEAEDLNILIQSNNINALREAVNITYQELLKGNLGSLNNLQIPTLIVEQNSLHFVPLLTNASVSLNSPTTAVKMSINSAESVVSSGVNHKQRGALGSPSPGIEKEPIDSNFQQNTLKTSPLFFASTNKPSSIKSREGLKDEARLTKILQPYLAEELVLGKAYAQGDCFFDALAQSLNRMNSTDINTDKYLRMLCHDYYEKNKALVDKLNLKDYGGVDKHDDYSMVQYTVEDCEKHFHGRSPIWGRPYVEGIMLCNQLNLRGLCIIEILEHPETKELIPSFHWVNQESYTSISEQEAKEKMSNPEIPTLVVEQNSLHFVPLIPTSVTSLKPSEEYLSAAMN